MLDSLLTMTKRGAFWLLVIFVVSAAMDFAVSRLSGAQEPLFLLFALGAVLAFIVSGVYTLGKKLFTDAKRSAPKDGPH